VIVLSVRKEMVLKIVRQILKDFKLKYLVNWGAVSKF
jgi:hypothetical protein